LGLPPLAEPNFIIAGKKSRGKNAPGKSDSGDDSQSGSKKSQDDAENSSDSSTATEPEVLPAPDESWMVASDRTGEASDESAGPGQDGGGQRNKKDTPADLDASEFEIPVGWFHLGCKEDVPPNACYVGQYRDRYAWVMASDVESLATFTLAVLTITKLEASESQGRSGLMFTP
jgi:hypothetical protein